MIKVILRFRFKVIHFYNQLLNFIKFAKFSKSFNDELHRVIIHGILHLLGFKDKKKSDPFAIEDFILDMHKLLELSESDDLIPKTALNHLKQSNTNLFGNLSPKNVILLVKEIIRRLDIRRVIVLIEPYTFSGK